MNIAFHDPKWVINIGMGQEAGLAAVPDDKFMRNMPAGFISTIFMSGMFPAMVWSSLCSSWAQMGSAIMAPTSHRGNRLSLMVPFLSRFRHGSTFALTGG